MSYKVFFMISLWWTHGILFHSSGYQWNQDVSIVLIPHNISWNKMICRRMGKWSKYQVIALAKHERCGKDSIVGHIANPYQLKLTMFRMQMRCLCIKIIRHYIHGRMKKPNYNHVYTVWHCHFTEDVRRDLY